MKLKYYLRGLGIGMVVTALLMGFATKDKNALTNEEIKERAKALGMVEQVTLADIRDNTPTTPAPANTQEPQDTETPPVVTEDTAEVPTNTSTQETDIPTNVPQEATASPDEGEQEVTTSPTEVPVEPENMAEPTETPAQEAEVTSEPVSPPENTELPAEDEVVIIVIEEGDSSETVSKRLANAGLVESASEFNKYLLKNKLTKVIDVGTYKIKKGSSIKEIAKIITN